MCHAPGTGKAITTALALLYLFVAIMAAAPAECYGEQLLPKPPGMTKPNSAPQASQTTSQANPELRRVETGRTPRTTGAAFHAVSRDYVLGAYDMIEVVIPEMAYVPVAHEKPDEDEKEWQVTISPQGSITLPLVGNIACAGMTAPALEEKLRAEFKRYLRQATPRVVVTRLRDIQVTIVGQVQSPGSYALPGATCLWDAIQQSGGILPSGSVRNVRITRRTGREQVVDLYPFLFGGREENNPALEPGDLVHVPVAERIVGLSGEVRQPALYEIRPGDDLAHLLALGGGPTARAAVSRAYVQRTHGNERPQLFFLDASKAQERDARANMALEDGDIVHIPSITALSGVISVDGEVKVPSTHPLAAGMAVRDLVELAGGVTAAAAPSRAYLTRVPRQGEKRRLTFLDLNRALKGDPEHNITLQDGDVLTVPAARLYYGQVSITGEVRAAMAPPAEPGTTQANANGQPEEGLEARAGGDTRRTLTRELQCDLVQGMRVSDLVRLAGGPAATAALDRARLVRIKPGGVKESLPLNLQAILAQPGSGEDLLLQDGDLVQVPSIAIVQQTVRIAGELVGAGVFQTVRGVVQRRGIYELKAGDSVRDMILSVGGVTANAALRAARIERRDAEGKTQRIPVDLHQLLIVKDPKADMALQNGDEFIVPAITDVVYVVGAVAKPGAYDYVEGSNRVMDMIARAGGTTARAILRDVQIVRADAGANQRPTRADMKAVMVKGQVSKDPGVQPGDIVVVPNRSFTMQDVMQTLANISLLRYYVDNFR